MRTARPPTAVARQAVRTAPLDAAAARFVGAARRTDGGYGFCAGQHVRIGLAVAARVVGRVAAGRPLVRVARAAESETARQTAVAAAKRAADARLRRVGGGVGGRGGQSPTGYVEAETGRRTRRGAVAEIISCRTGVAIDGCDGAACRAVDAASERRTVVGVVRRRAAVVSVTRRNNGSALCSVGLATVLGGGAGEAESGVGGGAAVAYRRRVARQVYRRPARYTPVGHNVAGQGRAEARVGRDNGRPLGGQDGAVFVRVAAVEAREVRPNGTARQTMAGVAVGDLWRPLLTAVAAVGRLKHLFALAVPSDFCFWGKSPTEQSKG